MCARAIRNGPSAITGCPVETIEEFARLVGATKRAYFRLGYGFARSRNGPVNMHAASCIPAITGAWLHEGGGAFHNNADIYHWDKSMIEGTRRARQVGPHARPVAHRRDPHRRPRGAQRRPAGHRDADPEHQSGVGLPGSGDGQARLCPRGPVRLRARAVHDRDGADGRRGAAGDHVHGARRRLSGRRPPIHHPRAEADRAARRMPLQPRGDLRAGEARRRASIRAST